MNDPANGSDEELANALSDSDDQAVAALADRYAQSLYDFALRLTLDTEAAAEIVVATFAHLRATAAQRPSDMSARAWLFNFAMAEGLEAANSRPPTGRLSTGDRRFTQTGPGIDREAALWAWQSARSLRPRDYAVLDLTTRRGLAPEELTGPATEGRGGIDTILTRASGAFAEAYVATALYFRGRDACRDLSELVGGSGAAMRVGIRRQIVSHVEDCETCQATLESLPGASDVFAALQDVEPPADLPQQVVAGAAAAAFAAGQLSLDDAAASDEEEVPQPADELPEQEEPEPEGPQEEVPPEEGPFEPEAEAEPPTEIPPASEEELWARPEAEAGFAGVASSDLPEAVSEIEERLGVEPLTPPDRPGEVYEQYGSEYEAEPPSYERYVARPLTLSDRLSLWFEPAYGRSFVPSYALLGVATAVAIFIGFALASALAGGGDDSLPAGGDVVREIACETGPMTVQSGATRTFEFDPASLGGFELDSVTVATRPAASSARSLVVEVAGATAMRAQAAAVTSPTARSDEYGLQIIWQRGSEDAVTDCPLVVNVPASAGEPSPTPGTPDSQETPEAEATP